MNRNTFTIGLAGAIHPNMPGDDTGLYRNTIEKLESLQQVLGFTLFSISEPIRSEKDACKVRDMMNGKHIDLFLLFSASLPYGRIILPLARIDAPIGIWAVPEPVTSGILQLNSYCGLNMLGSILKNYFIHDDLKYKWFYGNTDSEMFRERLGVTIRALRALKTLRQSRIGQIGDLADGFENLHVDERDLLHRFGTTLQTRHTVEDVVRRAQLFHVNEVETYVDVIAEEGSWDKKSVSTAHMEKLARLNMAFDDLAEEYDYDALAISCWSKFQEIYDIAVCGAMSRLNNRGIVAPCEADVSSAVSMIMLNAINGGKSSLNDMVALDEEDQSLNIWHCGVAPGCWADACGIRWDAHFNIGVHRNNEWDGAGVVADMQFKPGAVTLVALDNRFENVFVLTGDIMEDKAGYSGSSGWMNNLKINGESVTIPDLINTISAGRVNHHYPAAFGHLDSEIREIAFWKDIRVLDPIPYKSHMSSFAF